MISLHLHDTVYIMITACNMMVCLLVWNGNGRKALSLHDLAMKIYKLTSLTVAKSTNNPWSRICSNFNLFCNLFQQCISYISRRPRKGYHQVPGNMPKTFLFLLTIYLGHTCVDAGWTRISGLNEIYFSNDRTTWRQAGYNCENRGMHLIKVDSFSLTSLISANSGEERWIGASDLATEGSWLWQDGTSAGKSSSYHNWNSNTGEPNGGHGENCAVADHNGGWIDLACWYQRKYICQKKATYYTDLYELDFSVLKKSWTLAKQFCERNGYRLVKIDSNSLTSFIASTSSEDRWIGASDTAKEGLWTWSDGITANDTTGVYRNWKEGEPSNGPTGEDCAIVDSNGKWDDDYCWYSKKFICQKDLPLSVSYNNHLYTFHRTERVDWDAAKIACASRGSRLAEIYDGTTNNIIKNNIISRNRDVQFFSGGTEVYNRRVAWDSGTTASYTAWTSGEPNNNDETKIALSKNGWNDVRASKELPYICEMANVSAITLPTPHFVIGKGRDIESVCSADGAPLARVYWNFSSTEVKVDKLNTIYQTKSNGRSVLQVGNATLTDEGNYTCIAENRAGNFSKTLTKEFELTVPSVPEYLYVEVQKCSPAINGRWRSNSRAQNVAHKLIIRNVGNASDTHEIQNLITDGNFTVNVKEWQTYNLTITPCPAGVCKGKYALSNSTRSPTVGRPGKASNATVNKTNKYSCSIKWQRPVDNTSDYVTNYKVIVGENFVYPPAGSTAERISEITVNKSQTAYVVKEKPNIRYNFGIQAQTCAGFGDVVWLNGSCVTDPKAPDNIAKPAALPNTGVDGTALVTINIPNQENGRISCLFVIVKVHNGSAFANNYASNYTRDDLIRANASTNTNEYIALALSYDSVSKNNRVVLGDGRITKCELSSTAKRRKRSDGNNVFVGRNLKLDSSKNNSVLIVTSSPTTGDILLKASESVRVVPATGSGTSSATTAVVGGVLGGLIAVLLILIVVILLLRKRKEKREKLADPLVNTQSENMADGGSQNGAFVESQYANIGDNPYEMSTDVIYQNHEAIIPTKKRTSTDIPMQEFEKTYNSMHANQGVAFTEQFQELTKRAKSQALSTAFASQPELKSKNRYKNILPYDTTRVPIVHNDNGYINACFIDGFEQKEKFIASQGPLSKTVNDFWLMIVEQKVTSIVMLARCVEAGKKKCEKYWPDVGATGTFGLVTVSNMNEVRSCGYVCRTLRVKAGLESEYETTVSQYHFLTWPDHGFPLTTSHILRMHQQVVNSHKNAGSSSPIVVHCSAGAGRTGTFIGYDYLLNESKSVGNADVFECVAKMRSQRVEMVQNCDQFILVHKLLLESHLFGNTDISRQEVLEKFSDSDYKKKTTADEFGNLSRVKPMDMTKKSTAEKICAYDRMRVKFFEDGDEIAGPLSASFVEAYNDSLKIMVTKEPTIATIELFWKVVCNLNITAVVTITEDEHDQLAYWNQGHEGGEFTVVMDSEQTTPNFIVRKLTIKGSESKSVTHLHLKLNSSQATRKTVSKINECVSRLQKELREIHGVALIHCKSGTGMSGVFCAMMNILERLAVEDSVDVFRAVKDLRDCKKGMIETQAQYALCYDGVLEYLRNFDTYSNFM